MSKKIFRIQDSDGRGPWKPGFSLSWVEHREDHKNLMPWIIELGPIHSLAMAGEHVGCGCETIKQLKRWITESEYKTLLGFGYKAVKMGVFRILGKTDIQCLFTRRVPLKENIREFNLYLQAKEQK